MSEHDLRRMIERASKTAETMFDRVGEINPLWIAMDWQDREHLMPVTLDKPPTVAQALAVFRQLGRARFVFISRVWIVERLNITAAELIEIDTHGCASQPDRIDAVMF